MHKIIKPQDHFDNIWFTSDTHYGHRNIACERESQWKSGFRNFESLEHMNRAIIENINDNVKKDDVIYHMGDWSFGGIGNIKIFYDQLICQNIILIPGNHDHHIKTKRDIQDLFLYVDKDLEIEINKQLFILHHYAKVIWNKSHHGSIHLFGHSHNTYNPITGKSMDVGIDSIYAKYGDYRPIHIDEVFDYMKDRSIHYVDHHSSGTTQ